ncbi:MAG: hypothetical protein RRC34_13170 [Lentisphaeria bacterium]|nr:hypothetical protein [Lentisphaeria bacterium]
MKTSDKEFSALLSLLQDDDTKVASLAMEHFLKLGDLGTAIAMYQDDGDSQVRKRMHQMSAILSRRNARKQFIEAVRENVPELWDGVCRVNILYDPQASLDKINRQARDLASGLPASGTGVKAVAAFMKDREFMVPNEDILDGELYMMDSVLETNFGSAAALCALASRVGELRGWESRPVLFEGRLCLLGHENILVDPGNDWKLRKLDADHKVHACAKKDVWMMFLSQLFLIALVDGQLRDLYHFGDLLTALNGGTVNDLPYPLGEK